MLLHLLKFKIVVIVMLVLAMGSNVAPIYAAYIDIVSVTTHAQTGDSWTFPTFNFIWYIIRN